MITDSVSSSHLTSAFLVDCCDSSCVAPILNVIMNCLGCLYSLKVNSLVVRELWVSIHLAEFKKSELGEY